MNPYAYYGNDIDPETGWPRGIDPQTGQPYPSAQTTQPDFRNAPTVRTAAPNITNEQDPQRAAMQDRMWAYGRGEDLRNYLDEVQGNTANDLRAANEYAFNLFDPLAQGRGGYSQDEFGNILQQGRLDQLEMTPEEIQAAGLSDEERAGIYGDPWSRMKWFDPNKENQLFDQGQGFRRGAVDDYGRQLSGSFDPNVLRPQTEFYDALAAGPSEYQARTREILDPTKLTVSQKFLDDYQLTPEEQQAMITAQGITSGTRDKAAIAEAERRSRAAGVDPLGTAALRQRNERQMKVDAADAMLQARIAAEGEAANRMLTGENLRLQSGQNLAGMQTDAERDIMNARYRSAMAGEDVRGATERDIADRTFQTRNLAGAARIQNEQDLAQEALRQQQSIAERGNQYQRDVESTQADRSRDLATNRQDTARYLQGQRYGRGIGTADRLSDRYRYGAEARRQDAQEGRAYGRELANRANQNWNQTQDRRLNLYGTQGALGQGATRTQAQLYQAAQGRPKWWERAAGAGLGALAGFAVGGPAGAVVGGAKGAGVFAQGGVVTKPTYALLGEEGPEAVVPLNGDPNAVVPPSMALRMGKRPPFDTAPQRVMPAYSQQYRYA